MRHVLSSIVIVASLVACGGEDTSSKQSTSSTEPTDPSGSATAKEGTEGSKATGSTGASCTAYIACCKQVAEKFPQAAASCDSTKSAIDQAQKQGASTASYESACKNGLDGFKQAGYCK